LPFSTFCHRPAADGSWACAASVADSSSPIAAPAPGPNAPPPPAHNGTAYWIKVAAQADGAFTVTNTRNGFSKTYDAR